MKQVLLLLCACTTLAAAQAQVSHKDTTLGWSVTLPKGWTKTTSAPNGQSELYTYNEKASTWASFQNSDSATLRVTVKELLPAYKNDRKAAMDQELTALDDVSYGLRQIGYKVESDKKKVTIAGKTCYKLTYHLSRNGKTAYMETYHWVNDTQAFVVATNYRKDPPDAKTKAILDKAVADIFGSF